MEEDFSDTIIPNLLIPAGATFFTAVIRYAILNDHTQTVYMTALTMDAAGMDAEEMLLELKTCGLNLRNDDEIHVLNSNLINKLVRYFTADRKPCKYDDSVW